MLSISKDANPNYLAKVVQLKGLKKHSNADRLQTVLIDFNNVITDLTAKDGDTYVYFPIECQINSEFISYINGFREKEYNRDKTKTGFFERNCRVRAMSLRGEKSEGFIIPFNILAEFAGYGPSGCDREEEFDTIGSVKICQKYIPPASKDQQRGIENARDRRRARRTPESRIIENLIHLHVDTLQLRKNIQKITPFDLISISYKLHGTSFWVSHVKVKRKLKWYEKLLKKFSIKIDENQHDYVYGSRKVVKNAHFDGERNSKVHFYEKDIWGEIKEEMTGKIPEGFTVYGEAVGFISTGRAIQSDYDYGCLPRQKKIYVYRITFTNDRGYVYNLSTNAVIDFCKRYDLEHVPYFYIGKLADLFPELDPSNHWHENVLKKLEEKFQIEDDCFMCSNKVPREGIVIRKETQFDFEAYKLKSYSFLLRETKELDKGVINIEDEQ